MDKMRMESVDMTAQNIERIGALFPNCITETKGEDGKMKKAINFDLLRQMLSGDVLEGDEAYEFTWVGKKAAIVEANKPIRKTLRPCKEESVDWDTTENLYIEGDNLEVLKLLQESYLGAIKVIYIDPACGTAGFLVSAGEYLKENHKAEIFFDRVKKDHYMNHMFHGYDMDRTMLRIGAMNMMTHGIDNPYIEYRDSLSDQNTDREKYTLILANPPFKGSLDADIVSADLLKVCKTKKTELLFLALFLRMLKVGGRCAVIVPDGVLFGSSTAHKAIRKEIVEGNRLEAVISMPSGVFKPYAGVSTAVLVFTKTGHGGTDNVWFYDMKADGFSLDDKRTEAKENDIPDIVKRFHNREGERERQRTEQSFLVPKEEIAQNGYDLSINKYKKVEYVPVEYPSTQEILADLNELELEITKSLAELEEML